MQDIGGYIWKYEPGNVYIKGASLAAQDRFRPGFWIKNWTVMFPSKDPVWFENHKIAGPENILHNIARTYLGALAVLGSFEFTRSVGNAVLSCSRTRIFPEGKQAKLWKQNRAACVCLRYYATRGETGGVFLDGGKEEGFIFFIRRCRVHSGSKQAVLEFDASAYMTTDTTKPVWTFSGVLTCDAASPGVILGGFEINYCWMRDLDIKTRKTVQRMKKGLKHKGLTYTAHVMFHMLSNLFLTLTWIELLIIQAIVCIGFLLII